MTRGHKASVCRLCLQTTAVELGEDAIDRQNTARFFHAGRYAIAAPLPVLGTSNHLRANEVQHDVPTELKEIRVLLDEDRLEAALEEVFNAAILAIPGELIAERIHWPLGMRLRQRTGSGIQTGDAICPSACPSLHPLGGPEVSRAVRVSNLDLVQWDARAVCAHAQIPGLRAPCRG